MKFYSLLKYNYFLLTFIALLNLSVPITSPNDGLPEVSNDNDEGGRSYEDRLNRINSSLFFY